MSIAVRIVGLLVDSTTEQPVILLQDPTRNRIMPIVIGPAEAGAIASELEHIHFPRPMTHDLLRELLHALGGRLEQVLINDLRDNTFIATLVVVRGEERLEIDARPSDAIALAVRCQNTIQVAEHVFEQASAPMTSATPGEDVALAPLLTASSSMDAEELRGFLEKLSPDDFGKYKM